MYGNPMDFLRLSQLQHLIFWQTLENLVYIQLHHSHYYYKLPQQMSAFQAILVD